MLEMEDDENFSGGRETPYCWQLGVDQPTWTVELELETD